MLLVALAIVGSAQKAKKAPDVEIIEAKSRRTEEKIAFDGKVRVTAEKPLKGLVLEFAFLSNSGDALTTQKIEVSDDTLDKGDETAFHAETNNPPGAIKYTIRAFDRNERELRTGNPGPFVIE